MATKVGLIGYGLAGRSFHAPLVASTRGLSLYAIATSRAAQVCAFGPDVRIVSDPQTLITDNAIELVVIATPNQTHALLARAALEAGKHVVVDKPFVTDLAEGEALIELARARRLLLSVFQNRRWDADFLTVRQLLEARSLGPLSLVEMAWDRYRPRIKPGWREEPSDGAGLLADLGPHLVDQALVLFGVPDHITADVAIQRRAARVDDWFDLRLHYGAMRVRLSSSTLMVAPRPRFALHGERGSFVKYGIDPQESVLRAGHGPDRPGYGEESPEDWGVLSLSEGCAQPLASRSGDWRCFYSAMANAIAGREPVPVDPAQALCGLHLIARARQSAKEGRTLRVT